MHLLQTNMLIICKVGHTVIFYIMPNKCTFCHWFVYLCYFQFCLYWLNSHIRHLEHIYLFKKYAFKKSTKDTGFIECKWYRYVASHGEHKVGVPPPPLACSFKGGDQAHRAKLHTSTKVTPCDINSMRFSTIGIYFVYPSVSVLLSS